MDKPKRAWKEGHTRLLGVGIGVVHLFRANGYCELLSIKNSLFQVCNGRNVGLPVLKITTKRTALKNKTEPLQGLTYLLHGAESFLSSYLVCS